MGDLSCADSESFFRKAQRRSGGELSALVWGNTVISLTYNGVVCETAALPSIVTLPVLLFAPEGAKLRANPLDPLRNRLEPKRHNQLPAAHRLRKPDQLREQRLVAVRQHRRGHGLQL